MGNLSPLSLCMINLTTATPSMVNFTPVTQYSLGFLCNSEDYKSKSPDNLMLLKKSVIPPGAKLDPTVQKLSESIARNYFFETNLKHDEKTTVSLRFSVERGVEILSSTDDRFPKIYEESARGSALCIPLREVLDRGMGNIRKTTVSEEERASSSKKFDQPLVYLDPFAYKLWKGNFEGTVQVDLDIKGLQEASGGGELTTASLRYPHMLKDIYDRFKKVRRDKTINVCIVGPGLSKPKDGLGCCPEFVELLGLFPNGNFLLLDRDEDAIEYLEGQIKKMKCAALDPATYVLRAVIEKNNPFQAPTEYKALLNTMGEEWKKMIRSPANGIDVLKGKVIPNMVMLSVNPDKIELRNFEINTSEFNEDEAGKFDVVVATLSIILAMYENPKDPLAILYKFLSTLKINGSMYIDYTLFEYILGSNEDFSERVVLLEMMLGNRLQIETIAISDYDKSEQGNLGTIWFTSSDIWGKGVASKRITTTSIVVLTRKEEKF